MTEEVKITPDEAEKGIRLRYWEIIKKIDRSDNGKYRANLKTSGDTILASLSGDTVGEIDPNKYDEVLNDIYSKDGYSLFKDSQNAVAALSLEESNDVWKNLQINQLVLEGGFDALPGADKTDLRKNKMEEFLNKIIGLQETFLLEVVRLEDKKSEEKND